MVLLCGTAPPHLSRTLPIAQPDSTASARPTDPEAYDGSVRLRIYNYAQWKKNIIIGLRELGAYDIALGLETYPEEPEDYDDDGYDMEEEGKEDDCDFDDDDDSEDAYEDEEGEKGEADPPKQEDPELEARRRDFERREAAGRNLVWASCTAYIAVHWWRITDLRRLWVALRDGCDPQKSALARQTTRMHFDNLCIEPGEGLVHFFDRLSLRRQALAGTDREVDDSAFAAQIFKALVWDPRFTSAVKPLYQLFGVESDLERFMSRLRQLEAPPSSESQQQEHGRQAFGGPASPRRTGSFDGLWTGRGATLMPYGTL